VFVRFD